MPNQWSATKSFNPEQSRMRTSYKKSELTARDDFLTIFHFDFRPRSTPSAGSSTAPCSPLRGTSQRFPAPTSPTGSVRGPTATSTTPRRTGKSSSSSSKVSHHYITKELNVRQRLVPFQPPPLRPPAGLVSHRWRSLACFWPLRCEPGASRLPAAS